MFYGGKHADGNTENCLIVFKDSTYIELIGLVKPAALDDPNGMHATLFNLGEGWAGFALLSEDLEHNVTEMQQRGLTLSGAYDNSRHQPDGELVAWRAATLSTDMMPFFLQDRTPHIMRVIDDERTQHANGATGATRIIIAVTDLTSSQTLYEKILDQPASASSLELEASNMVDFQMGLTTLTLAAPNSDASPLHMYLLSNIDPVPELDPSRLQAASLILVKPV